MPLISMGKVILIGTEHGDLKGSERLESLLEIVRPDILSVESSLESLRRSKNNPMDIVRMISEAKERGVSSNFIRFFDDLIAKHGLTDFEYTTSKSYADRHKIPLYLSDDPTLANACRKIKLDLLHRIILGLPANTDIPIPSEEELVRDTDKRYEFANDAINGEIPREQIDNFLDDYRGVLIGQRDTYMAERIRQISTGHQKSLLVHTCGFAHLFDDLQNETLYSRIKDLNPERRLLYCPEPTV